jgi:hypothetical protein
VEVRKEGPIYFLCSNFGPAVSKGSRSHAGTVGIRAKKIDLSYFIL